MEQTETLTIAGRTVENDLSFQKVKPMLPHVSATPLPKEKNVNICNKYLKIKKIYTCIIFDKIYKHM
jgi:hypothetical protein